MFYFLKSYIFRTLLFCVVYYSFLGSIPSVDTSLGLCSEELSFIRKRDSFVQDRIFSIVQDLFSDGFDKDINKLPRIAFCFSGGGNRALITSLGFMQGMKDCGLTDCVSYCSFLSGSAWFYISFLLKNMNLEQYRDFIRSRLSEPFNKSFYGIWNEFSQVSNDRGYFSISDIYGRSLYNYLLGDTVSSSASFEDIRNSILSSEGHMPFPLFTAIVKNEFPYKWLEVNPFVSGSDELGGYVRTKNWGSCFEEGVCTKEVPEISLASFMGIFGSAYCLNRADFDRSGVLESVRENLKSQTPFHYLDQVIGRVKLPDNLLFSAMQKVENKSMFENFLYGMGGVLSEHKRVIVADAGLDFDLPTPPLLKKERGIDLIFVCDASQNNGCDLFASLFAHASRNGVTLPDFNNPIKVLDDIWIFEDQNPSIPTIVYFKLTTQFSTLKFSYTGSEFDTICEGTRDAVVCAKYAINLAIRRKTVLINNKSLLQPGLIKTFFRFFAGN